MGKSSINGPFGGLLDLLVVDDFGLRRIGMIRDVGCHQGAHPSMLNSLWYPLVMSNIALENGHL